MSESQSSPGTIHTVAWSQVFPWLILARAARVSMMVRVLALAVLGVVATHAGWRLVEEAFGQGTAEGQLTEMAHERPTLLEDEPPLASTWLDAFANAYPIVERQSYSGPLVQGWAWAIQPLTRQLQSDSFAQWFRLALCGGWTIAVWALFGGAIARITAVRLTREESLGPVAALLSAARFWTTTAGAPAVAYLGILLLAAPLILAGLALRSSVLGFFTGLLWPLALVGGWAVLMIAVGLVFGWPLMWAAAAVERTDAFDALSRAYAYVLQRPLQLAFFIGIASGLGLLAQFIVAAIVSGAVWATDWAVSMGAGQTLTGALLVPTDEPSRLGWFDSGARSGIQFWKSAALGVVAAFPLAYVWPASTAIYLLLRRHVDA
ncbi:MAG: hypothetical protein AAF961_16600, partial [Planctomycetota bacterium]